MSGQPRLVAQLVRSILRRFGPETVFETGVETRLESDPEFQRVAAILESVRHEGALAAGLELLRITAIQGETGSVQPGAEFVVTFPRQANPAVRTTTFVMGEMLGRARHEVFAAGYVISDSGIIAGLQAATRRGARVTLVCDRGQRSGQAILDSWPDGLALPMVYQDRPGVAHTQTASMHTKVLVIDQLEMLLSSANFTFQGLNENIEMGVHLKQGQAAEAVRLFMRLVDDGFLERLDSHKTH